MTLTYRAFLEAKRPVAAQRGPSIDVAELHPALSPHARDIVRWAIPGGRRGIFAKFGLHKTRMQLEICRRTVERLRAQGDGRGALVSAPLGVRLDFRRDAEALGIDLNFGRSDAELDPAGINLTNHESIREGKIDLSRFAVLSLDEAAVLRDTGSKTFREFYRQTIDVPFKYVATAVPDPNDHIELLNYAMVLGVMDIGEAKTRFFRRNSEQADALTLHPHKVEEFWLWVSTWACFVQRPSDINPEYSDEGFDLPELDVRYHAVADAQPDAGREKDGQGRMFHDAGMGVSESAQAARSSLTARIAKVRELIEASPRDHFIIWHHREDERRAIEAAIPGVVSVYGSQDLDEREDAVAAFSEGKIKYLAAKPEMLGSGCNLQHHCHRAIYAGVNDLFHDFIQSIHRIHRYGQKRRVRIDIVHAHSQIAIVRRNQVKWKQHDETTERTSDLIRRYGLSPAAAIEQLGRSMGVARRVANGAAQLKTRRTAYGTVAAGMGDDRWESRWTAVNNDTVEETAAMASNSVGMECTSIPFSTQYEYTPSYNDFGHTDDKGHFFRQMDFLTPELYRVLEPGRILAVHVKDRIRPGGYDGRSFQSIDFFHADCIQHYQSHGFVGMGMITVVTDVVRENAGNHRLSWKMQRADGSRMGCGTPEYVLLFRKPPTDPTSGFADDPVVKSKDEYTKGRWQMEAHAFWKSNGNRLLGPDDFIGRQWPEIFQKFRGWTMATPYDHERVVAIAEAMDAARQLPPDFMLLQPGTDHPDVWCDVFRAGTLNNLQAAANREKHLCPLQFDIVDRLIRRFTNPDDLVYDPFGGLGTVALRALKLGRRGLTVELNPRYHDDAVRYLRAFDEQANTPTLFDAIEASEGQPEPEGEPVEVG